MRFGVQVCDALDGSQPGAGGVGPNADAAICGCVDEL